MRRPVNYLAQVRAPQPDRDAPNPAQPQATASPYAGPRSQAGAAQGSTKQIDWGPLSGRPQSAPRPTPQPVPQAPQPTPAAPPPTQPTQQPIPYIPSSNLQQYAQAVAQQYGNDPYAIVNAITGNRLLPPGQIGGTILVHDANGNPLSMNPWDFDTLTTEQKTALNAYIGGGMQLGWVAPENGTFGQGQAPVGYNPYTDSASPASAPAASTPSAPPAPPAQAPEGVAWRQVPGSGGMWTGTQPPAQPTPRPSFTPTGARAVAGVGPQNTSPVPNGGAQAPQYGGGWSNAGRQAGGQAPAPSNPNPNPGGMPGSRWNGSQPPPAQGGQPGGGQPGQPGAQPGGGGQGLPISSELLAAKQAAADSLAAELAGLNYEETQIQPMVNLMLSRLSEDEAEDMRQIDEEMNARGLYDSGVRTHGRRTRGEAYGRQRSDIALDTGRRVQDIGLRRQRAQVDYQRRISDALMAIARIQAQTETAPVGNADKPKSQDKSAKPGNTKKPRGKQPRSRRPSVGGSRGWG